MICINLLQSINKALEVHNVVGRNYWKQRGRFVITSHTLRKGDKLTGYARVDGEIMCHTAYFTLGRVLPPPLLILHSKKQLGVK